ncbi:MAG TPA: 4-(cytidine 5'-diphospho)-2-C-methyl-D-erythritol kinase, partial [Candidatus Omnitrophica bacterium]|nr:4-(cytidine 5'-diphospho)-2-C-methyl-D-erythritol kinase [Candidatus Omnitrophota bacterium]
MERINLSSYAKINLYLKVLKKRSDGYHDIETIYQAITLKDNIAIRLIKGNNDIEIYSNSRQIPTDATNLAYQAVLVLLDRLNIRCGVRIDIDKNIPVSAGLGGGSSNAASCILGLNKLLRLKLNKKE